ncbi:MAG: MATE family efflux transporter [Ignavibacteriales bacterium]
METRNHPIDEARRATATGTNHNGTVLRQEVLRLALPAILEMTAHMSIWMVDTAMVGRLGPEALSAVGMAGQVFWTVTWVFGALGTGTVALASRAFGAGDKEETSRLASESIAVAALMSVFLFAILRGVAGPASNLIAMSGAVREQMREYVYILSYATLPILLQLTGTAVLRATGDTRTPLIIAGLANSFNAVGDWVLIFGKLGFPRLGVRGAAIASAASFVLGDALVMIVLVLGRNGVRLRFPSLAGWRWETAGRLLTLSAPAGLETLLMDGARSVQMFIMTALGDIGFAANQVAVSCESLSFMPGYGFAIASSIMVGQSLGAGEAGRAKAGALECLRMGMLVMGGIGVLFLAIPQHLVSLFTQEPRVVSQAAVALRTAGLFQTVLAATDVLNGALRGSGDTRTPLKITALGAWLLRIPLTYLAVRTLRLPLVAVWLVNGLDWIVRASAVTIAFRSGRWAKTGTLIRGSPERA